ncbi:hypothetical protein SPFM12_00098 [Salmonella phage SPFM12]|nr:hypothetical protein SPFM12_00098 [Salmonella phage SPFM12]
MRYYYETFFITSFTCYLASIAMYYGMETIKTIDYSEEKICSKDFRAGFVQRPDTKTVDRHNGDALWLIPNRDELSVRVAIVHRPGDKDCPGGWWGACNARKLLKKQCRVVDISFNGINGSIPAYTRTINLNDKPFWVVGLRISKARADEFSGFQGSNNVNRHLAKVVLFTVLLMAVTTMCSSVASPSIVEISKMKCSPRSVYRHWNYRIWLL